MTDDKNPVWVHCKCEHEWIAAWMPMQMDILAQLLTGIRCPMCGGGEKIYLIPNPPATA